MAILNNNEPDDEEVVKLRSTVEILDGTRSIFIRGDFDERMATKFHQCILTLEGNAKNITEDQITIFVHSGGGYLHSCFYMIDVMQASPCPISTVGCGYAMSAACLLVAAGDPKLRFAMPRTILMLHELSTQFVGKYSELTSEYFSSAQAMTMFVDILCKATGKKPSTLRKIIEKDVYFDVNAAMKFGPRGLVDGIWSNEGV